MKTQTEMQTWIEKASHSSLRLGMWTLLWLITLALATFGPMFLWPGQKVISGIAVLVNLAVGIGMVLSHIRNLKNQDELQQKIQLDAMGLSLGAAVIGGISYSLLDITNLIGFHAEISHLVILIALTYVLAISAGNRRYR